MTPTPEPRPDDRRARFEALLAQKGGRRKAGGGGAAGHEHDDASSGRSSQARPRQAPPTRTFRRRKV